MKRLKLIIGIVCSFGLTVSAIGQQTRQSNLYTYNGFSYNPAYAGSSGCTEVNFSHMNQWIKVDGAPVTNQLNANTRIGKALGIGGTVLLDRAGMFQQLNASLGLSYGFVFAQEHKVRLGIGAGFFQLRLDPSEAIALDAGDVIVEGGQQASNALNTEAGLVYMFKGLELSFASKQLIETRSKVDYANLDGYGLKRHLLGYVGYDILLNKRMTLKPNLFYKGIDATAQFDFNLDLNYNDFIYGGLGYRTGVGMVGRLGVNIRKFFFVAYSYEIPMQNIARQGSGSHEIGLGLKFCKKEKQTPEVSEVVPDTIRIIEQIVDTLIVERVDTVYVQSQPVAVSDAKVHDAMLQAENTLEFETDRAIIRKNSYGDLEALTNILLVRDDVKINLEGHTDNVGTEEYNMRLSKDRVEAVKTFLVANGVAAERIAINYFGESKPIADNNTEEGRAKNRRVEIKVKK